MLHKLINVFSIGLIIGLVVAVSYGQDANPTAISLSNTRVSNGVTLDYNNASGVAQTQEADYVVDIVQRIRGLRFNRYSSSSNASTTASTETVFRFKITNGGNVSADYNISSIANNYSTGAAGWTFATYVDANNNNTWDGSGTDTSSTSITVAPNTSRSFFIGVTPAAGAVDQQSWTNWVRWIDNDATTNNAGAYVVGSETYGGAISTTNILTVTLEGPVVNVYKYSSVASPASYQALPGTHAADDLVPGSVITYVVAWTNSGSGSIQTGSLVINDNWTAVDTAIAGSLEYKAGSLKYVDDPGTVITTKAISGYNSTDVNTLYSGGTALTDDNSDEENAGGNNVDGGRVGGSAPYHQVQFDYDAVIAGGPGTLRSGAVMYQVDFK